MTSHDVQPAAHRHQIILHTVQTRGSIRAVAIAEQLGVTHETVRKDLSLLESRGLLRRVHGGAVPAQSLSYEPALTDRTRYRAEKGRIAAAARQFVPDGGAVLIDSGSTTGAFAAGFPAVADLNVLTSSLPIATSLMAHPGLTVRMVGGRVRPQTLACVDRWALDALEHLLVDVAFLGTNAFSLGRGLSTPDEAEGAVKAAMVRAARFTVLLADHTKYGREALFRYADLADIDVVITDDGLPVADAEVLTREAGVEVLRV